MDPRDKPEDDNAHRSIKIVEWSKQDQGSDERAVFDALCVVVDEVIALYQADKSRSRPRPRVAISQSDSNFETLARF